MHSTSGFSPGAHTWRVRHEHKAQRLLVSLRAKAADPQDAGGVAVGAGGGQHRSAVAAPTLALIARGAAAGVHARRWG